MSKYDGYHTALAPEPFRLEPLDCAHFSDGSAFQYDLMQGSPSWLNECDILYSELPWRKGFTEFERRAGYSDRAYNDFLGAVRVAVNDFGGPAVMVTGAHALKRLDPDDYFQVCLNGEWMLALTWKCRVKEGFDTTRLLDWLARRYSVLGDFCCGYGATAKAARNAGKRFIVSDYNGSCIRYIFENMSSNIKIAA